MKRAELYALVWEKPMTHVAKRFGISDVALRKICVKHDIPTPPLGYWAKLASGKKVVQSSLPSSKKEENDTIYLTEQPASERPFSVERAESEALERENIAENKIIVPSEKPDSLNLTALSVERLLKKAKLDHEGFIGCSGPGLVEVKIGPALAQRVVVLIDTFFKALKHRNYEIREDEGGVAINIDGELFRLSIEETRDRKAHEPTAEELKRQKERDAWRARFPDLYSSNKQSKVYRSWDYFPSGRLYYELFSKDRKPWLGTTHAGRWYDRSTKKAEEYLNSSIIALVSTSALIKHEKAVAAEQERLREEEALRRRREQARRERHQKRCNFLDKKAEDYSQYLRLKDFASYLKGQVIANDTAPVDRLARVLNSLLAEREQRFGRESLNSEITDAKLFEGEDQI